LLTGINQPVLGAHDGARALELAREHADTIDILVYDMDMAGHSWLRTTRAAPGRRQSHRGARRG
jgi:CheY-like chemotaxis protein